jgi:uncharacterized DUF497 family protein
MFFQLTQHARDAMQRRGIPLEWVEVTLRSPDWVEVDRLDSTLEHRLAVIPAAEGRVLRVVVNVDTQPVRVVTAFLDRRRTAT